MNLSQSINKRITHLEDYEAIKNLKYRYFDACDKKDTQSMIECFSHNAVHIDYEDFGKFNTAKKMVNKFKLFSCFDHLLEHHSGKNPIIKITKNNASAHWSLSYFLVDTNKKITLNLTGFYKDIYIKESGKWLIKESVFKKTSSFYQKIDKGVMSNPIAARSLGFK